MYPNSMTRSTLTESIIAKDLVMRAAMVMASLTIANTSAGAEVGKSNIDSSAKQAGTVHQKHSGAVTKQPDPNAEIRKELNLPETPVTHGFHPIKETMGEIREIESINMRLYEQMKKLEIPVAGLQPTMLQLQNTMLHVDGQMDITHKQLSGVGDRMDLMHKSLGGVGSRMEAMQKQMGTVGDKMEAMHSQMGSVGDKMGAMHDQIGRVGEKMDAMQGQLLNVGKKMDGMHGQLGGVEGQVKQMEAGMSGLRQDLKSIRSDLTAVRTQVSELQKPIEQIRDPLLEVAGPLEGLGQRLDRLQALVSYVLMAIVLATLGIAIGTPIAAYLILKRRGGLFFSQAPSADKGGSNKVS